MFLLLLCLCHLFMSISVGLFASMINLLTIFCVCQKIAVFSPEKFVGPMLLQLFVELQQYADLEYISINRKRHMNATDISMTCESHCQRDWWISRQYRTSSGHLPINKINNLTRTFVLSLFRFEMWNRTPSKSAIRTSIDSGLTLRDIQKKKTNENKLLFIYLE